MFVWSPVYSQHLKKFLVGKAINPIHLFSELNFARQFHPHCRLYPLWQGNVGRTIVNDGSILAQLRRQIGHEPLPSLNEGHLSLS